jgi:TM2 domain-containing membrane protein YozV
MKMKRSGIWFLALSIAVLPLAGNARVAAFSPIETDQASAEAASVSHGPTTMVVERAAVRAWSPSVAAALSLVIPGSGQMYKGQTRGGFLWLGAVVLGYMTFIIPGIVLHVLCVISAAQGDPMTPGRWA